MRVMPSAQLPAAPTRAAALALASNERESFQVALRAASNSTFDVHVEPLASADGGQVELTWNQVGLMNVTSIKPNSQGAEGWWPDVCLRTPRAFGVAGLATSVWFTLHAPVGTPAGEYAGSVTLTPTDGGGDAVGSGTDD